MKQRDLLFAGLLLFGVPAFAQDSPTIDPTKDAKVIFTQDFESDWDKWINTPIDSITELQYYVNPGSGNPGNGQKPWQNQTAWRKGPIRTDSTDVHQHAAPGRGGIILFNGIVTCDEDETWTDDPNEQKIITDKTSARRTAFLEYGEADGGGEYILKYVADSCSKAGANSWTESNKIAARYRRNLFVRGLDVEEHSSYRLTFYAKASTYPGHTVDHPTLFADIMRGYFHAEKPFSMSYFDRDGSWKGSGDHFEFTKDDFQNDVWEKCVMMTYYSTADIANWYVFQDGYWWSKDSWLWKADAEGNTTKSDIGYIVQPDKFFVRIGFATNYSEYYIDNISLTKSWIGGCEYYGDKMRINFGYDTNLKDLAKAAYKKTRIAAQPIPGDYFEVWGQFSDGTWEEVYMESAEYHTDGYMYMFTDTYEDPRSHKQVHYDFSDYEKVLVTFHNPEDPAMQLKYTGNLYPKVDDRDWVDAGKIVPDFYNEIATPNQYVFNGVYPISDLPPVYQGGVIEDGSFNLDPNTKELRFKFTREMDIDNKLGTSSKLVAYVDVNGGEEVWEPSWDEANKQLVIKRPNNKTTPLSGDAEISLVQIFLPNTTRQGDDVTISYNFGTGYTRSTSGGFADFWDAKFYDTEINVTSAAVTPAGTAISYNEWGDQWKIGNGQTNATSAARLWYYSEGVTFTRALMISPRNNANSPARLYLGYGTGFEINLQPGGYRLEYLAEPVNKTFGFKVYVYPWDERPDKIADSEKILVADHSDAFTSHHGETSHVRQDKGITAIDTVLTIEFGDVFMVDDATRYIVEICTNGANNGDEGYPSMLYSNFKITKAPVSYGPIYLLNEAVAAAEARKALADADQAKYTGAAYNALVAQINANKVGGTFDAAQPNKPSVWSAAANATKDATKELKLRMDTVDLVVAKLAEVGTYLDKFTGDSATIPSYISLKTTHQAAYTYPDKTNAQLSAFIKSLDDAMKSIDKRLAKIADWDSLIHKSNNLIAAQEQKTIPEYTELKAVVDGLTSFSKWSTSDEDFLGKFADIEAKAYAYASAVQLAKVATRRLDELKALATKYGTNVADSSFVKDALAATRFDIDDYIALVFKSYITAAMYDKIANGGGITSEDLSAYIKNYYLYATPIVNNQYTATANLNNSTGDGFPGKDDRLVADANIHHGKHRWDPIEVWAMFLGEDITNLFPGWTVNVSGDQNRYATCDTVTTAKTGQKTYPNFQAGLVAFDGALAIDWGTTAVISTEVTDLPAGEYSLGIDHRALYSYKNKGDGGSSTMSVQTAKDVVLNSKSFAGKYLGPDSVYLVRESTGLKDSVVYMDKLTPTSNDTIFDTVKVVKLENIAVADNDTMWITVSLGAKNGNERIDNFNLIFKPKAGFDYAAEAVKAKDRAIKVLTLVDAARPTAGKVEYYTLSGMKLNAPKRGEILVRKSTQANGKVVVDKVLIK